MISSPGVGSGLDINSLISQLMSLEKRPLQALQQKENLLNDQLSAYGKLKSALSTFQDAVKDLNSIDKFQAFAATSSNEEAFSVTADSTAAAGSYNIVVEQLAQRHKLASDSLDPATALGGGSLDISVAGNSFNVPIASGNSTLAEIRDAINGAADNTGVTATIINEGAASRLVLTADESGAANAVSVAVNDSDGASDDNSGLSRLLQSGTFDMKELVVAQDARLTIDTLAISSASNSVSGAIEGVTLNLLKGGGVAGAASGTLDVSRDDEAVRESVQTFVDSYNELRATIDKYYTKGGTLEADSTVRSLGNSIREVLNTAANGVGLYTHLSEVGIQSQKDGTLKLDADTFNAALDKDFDGVAGLFGDASQGAMVRMFDAAEEWLQYGGLLQNRTDGIDDRIDSLQARMDLMEVRLDTVERRYRDQFTNLDAMLGQMQSTSTWLASQLAALG